MSKLQIIAGVLGVFFLTVTIVKSIVQAAAKREAKRKSLEQSNGGTVSLHNPYPGEAPEAPAAQADADTATGAPASAAASVERPEASDAVQPPPHESAYKWN